jgi:hypothetical protein
LLRSMSRSDETATCACGSCSSGDCGICGIG